MHIRNQLNDFSCTACAICASLENTYELSKLSDKKLYEDVIAFNKSHKVKIEDTILAAKTYGIFEENSKKRHKIVNSIGLGNTGDVILAIKRSWAVVISFHVKMFSYMKEKDSLYFFEKGNFRHSAALLYYDDLNESFVLQNSWGAAWGTYGCCRVPRKLLDDKNLIISSYGLILGNNK